MGYNNELLDFSKPQKSKEAILKTWDEFRSCLGKGDFSYDDVEYALQTDFMRVLNDFFVNHGYKELYTKTLSDIFRRNNVVMRGTILKEDEKPEHQRFLPISKYITDDNRFSPEGVEWLYLAVGSLHISQNIAIECTVRECKAVKGDRFAACEFILKKENRFIPVVDLTIGAKYSFDQIQNMFNEECRKYVTKTASNAVLVGIMHPQTPTRVVDKLVGKYFSMYYAKIVSENLFVPVTSSKKYMYSPFQCLAKYFESIGYKGILYSSVECPDAKNLVLFDKYLVEPYGDIKIFTV